MFFQRDEKCRRVTKMLQLKKKKKRIHQKSIRTSGLEERVHELERSIEHTQTETLIGKKKGGKKRKRTILWDNIK